jgi:hypothetical protein
MSGSSAAIRAGKAFVEYMIDEKGVRKQLNHIKAEFQHAGHTIQHIGKEAMKIGAEISAVFLEAAHSFASSGSELERLHKKTGISVESLDQLRFAGEESGVGLDTLAKGMKGMEKFFLAASQGGGDTTATLQALNLTFEDLKALAPEQRFALLADRLAQVADPTMRAGLAMKVFGKAGDDLIPLIDGGNDSLRAAMATWEKFGWVMSEKDAGAAHELHKAWVLLWNQLKAINNLIGAAVAGALTDFLHATAPIVKTVIDWVNANRPLIATVAAAGAILLAAGVAIYGIGTALSLVGTMFGFVASGIGVVASVIGFLVSPLGLTIAAVAGVVYWFTTMTETGQGMVASLSGWFGELASIAKTSFGAIATALGAGDIAAAADVLWTTLKLLWLQGTQALDNAWNELVGGMVKIWFTAVAGVEEFWNEMSSNLERGWSHTTEFIGNGWSQTVEFMSTFWDTTVGALKKSWNSLVAFFETTWLRIKGLFGGDVTGEIDRINSELTAANNKIDATNANKAADRNAAAAADRDQRSGAAAAARDASRKDQAAALDAIGKDLADKLGGTDQSTKDKIAATQAALDDARAKWSEATAAANAVGAASEEQKKNVAVPGLTNDLGKVSSLGTFSADAVASLQGGGAQQETAENTRAMRRSLDRMERLGNTTLVGKS